MKKKEVFIIFAALLTLMQGVWAQTSVTMESELREAIKTDGANILLADDIQLASNLTINVSVTIDLNGKALSGNGIASTSDFSCIFVVAEVGHLEISNGTLYGADNSGNTTNDNCGGAIMNRGTVKLSGVTITGCKGTRGGAICNCSGAQLSLIGCTITDNIATTRGGGIYNDGTLNLKECTINCNMAANQGGGIYNAGIFNVWDWMKVNNNGATNLFLSGNTIIDIQDQLTIMSEIFISMEKYNRVFAINFPDGTDPNDVFISDLGEGNWSVSEGNVSLAFDGVLYGECEWDAQNKIVKATTKYQTAVSFLTNQRKLSGWYYNGSNNTISDRITINGDTHIILKDGNTLTCKKGIYIKDGATLYIHPENTGTGMLICPGGGGDNAAIGGNKNVVAGHLVIYGGTIEAKADHNNAAGIGGGNGEGSGIRSVTIYGGDVTAWSKSSAAGIGKGQNNNVWEVIRIYGGNVKACGCRVFDNWSNSNYYGAGIGGAENRGNGLIEIFGGNVEAFARGNDAAGIGGGGDGSQDRPIRIYGGIVRAVGGKYAAAIGGGKNGNGGEVYIGADAIVTLKPYSFQFFPPCIGAGKGKTNDGVLTLEDDVKVCNWKGKPILAQERVKACRLRQIFNELELSRCDHSDGFTYTVTETQHISHCKYCMYSEKEEHQILASGVCNVCGYSEFNTCSVGIFTVKNNHNYEGSAYLAVKDQPFTLPVCEDIPEGYKFVGWMPKAANEFDGNGFESQDGETILLEGDDYTPTGNINLFARYQKIEILLYDDQDNEMTLNSYNGMKTMSVTLEGRKLYKDGSWNTLCLPFTLNDFTDTPLEGAMVKTLEETSLDNNTSTMTLYFSDNLASIEAGKPYIVKWDKDTEQPIINDPTFYGVTISNQPEDIETQSVTFCGNYNPFLLYANDRTKLYLGDGDKLYYPFTNNTINSFRAYFQLANSIFAGDLSDPDANALVFKLNLDGEETTSLSEELKVKSEEFADWWYSLDGRKLNGKPKAKGIFINNGHKFVVK